LVVASSGRKKKNKPRQHEHGEHVELRARDHSANAAVALIRS
jgi:hypothetical protein